MKKNFGLLKEKELVSGLFKNNTKFKTLEIRLIGLAKEKSLELNQEKITVYPVSNQDNRKENHTWDCFLSDGVNKVGISIKTNNNPTTKHPQHKSLIGHIFGKESEDYKKWLGIFTEKTEEEAKQYLLNRNPLAQTLKDVRKDEQNKTISEVDFSLGKIYQTFFYNLFKEGLTKEQSTNFLKFCLSSKEYIKVSWNNNDKFVVSDYLSLSELHNKELTNVKFIEKNNNVELSFGDLVLTMRFKISFYKKQLLGSAVKSEIKINKLPDCIKKYEC